MTGRMQTLQSNKLVHICSSCLALIYHSLPHLDPETLKLLFCFVLDHLICSLENISDRGETGQFQYKQALAAVTACIIIAIVILILST